MCQLLVLTYLHWDGLEKIINLKAISRCPLICECMMAIERRRVYWSTVTKGWLRVGPSVGIAVGSIDINVTVDGLNSRCSRGYRAPTVGCGHEPSI